MKAPTLPLFARNPPDLADKQVRRRSDSKKPSPDEAAFGAKLATAMAVTPPDVTTVDWRDQPPNLQRPFVRVEARSSSHAGSVAASRSRRTPLPPAFKSARTKDTLLLSDATPNEETMDANEAISETAIVAAQSPVARLADFEPPFNPQWVAPAQDSTDAEVESVSVAPDQQQATEAQPAVAIAAQPIIAPLPSLTPPPTARWKPTVPLQSKAPPSALITSASPQLVPPSVVDPSTLMAPSAKAQPSSTASVPSIAAPAASTGKDAAPIKKAAVAIANTTQTPTTLSLTSPSRPQANADASAPGNAPVPTPRPAESAHAAPGDQSANKDGHPNTRSPERQTDLDPRVPTPALANQAAAPSLSLPQPPATQPLAAHASPRSPEPSAATSRATVLTGTDLLDLAPLGVTKIDLQNNEARVSIDTDSGALSLHVRVRQGVADVSIDGHAAAHVGSHSRDLEAYLHKEGLTLGRFTVDDSRPRGGDSSDSDERRSWDARQDADEGDGTGDAETGIERPVSGEPTRVRKSGRVHVKA